MHACVSVNSQYIIYFLILEEGMDFYIDNKLDINSQIKETKIDKAGNLLITDLRRVTINDYFGSHAEIHAIILRILC